MERFQYYGSGRYFAVTNKFSDKYETVGDPRNRGSYVYPNEIEYKSTDPRKCADPIQRNLRDSEEPYQRTFDERDGKLYEEPEIEAYDPEPNARYKEKYQPIQKSKGYSENLHEVHKTKSKDMAVEDPENVDGDYRKYGGPIQISYGDMSQKYVEPKQHLHNGQAITENGKDPKNWLGKEPNAEWGPKPIINGKKFNEKPRYYSDYEPDVAEAEPDDDRGRHNELVQSDKEKYIQKDHRLGSYGDGDDVEEEWPKGIPCINENLQEYEDQDIKKIDEEDNRYAQKMDGDTNRHREENRGSNWDYDYRSPKYINSRQVEDEQTQRKAPKEIPNLYKSLDYNKNSTEKAKSNDEKAYGRSYSLQHPHARPDEKRPNTNREQSETDLNPSIVVKTGPESFQNKIQYWSTDAEKDILSGSSHIEPYDSDVGKVADEPVRYEIEEPAMKEVHLEKVEEINSKLLEVNEFPISDRDSNIEGDWPPPPPDQAPDQDEKLEEQITERRNSEPKQDLSLYTSFLTIDVSSGKRDGPSAPSLEDTKHRASLLNLVTGSHEIENDDEAGQVDKEDMEKIRHDLEMISKYLHSMPLGASYWPQNYDVLRDLVKLYLAAKNTNNAVLNYLLDYFLKLGWPDIFLKCARKIMKSYPQVFLPLFDSKIPFEDPTPETLDMAEMSLEYAVAVIFQVILSLAAEFTEVHEESKKVGHRGFLHFIFYELLPKLHGIPWGQSSAREEFLHSCIDILYNYAQSITNTACFYECNGVEILTNLRKETDSIGGNRVNIGALLTLSFLIDDRNNHLIFSDPATIGLLIHYVEESLSKIDHCYADFSLSELVDGITRIGAHDSNKFVICARGGISIMSKVLRKTKDNEERIAVCRLLWSLCFVEKCKQKIIGRSPEIYDIVGDLQSSENTTLQQLAEALIWEFEGKYTDQNPAPDPDVKHIFISYHPEQIEVMQKISARLQQKGYKVCLGKSRDQTYPGHLIEAIENAAVVLIGVSRKYKQSPTIFAEADYAFHMCKPMIPITLEKNYKPDGWLGMLVGSKVWLDFSETSKFEGHIQLLLRQIGERGKSERTINILYVQDHKHTGSRNDDSQNRLIDIARWDNQDVVDWLQRNNLKNCVSIEKLKKLQGSHLLRLHHLRRESPDFYYNSLEPQLGFTDVIDMMEFTQALEALTEQN